MQMQIQEQVIPLLDHKNKQKQKQKTNSKLFHLPQTVHHVLVGQNHMLLLKSQSFMAKAGARFSFLHGYSCSLQEAYGGSVWFQTPPQPVVWNLSPINAMHLTTHYCGAQ